MHDALGVRGLERVGDLDGQIQQPLRSERLALDHVLQRGAFQQLHDDEGLAFVLADLVDGADVRVIQGCGRPRLTPKPVEGALVPRRLAWQELERDVAIEDGVLRAIDDAHAAASQLLDDAIVRHGTTDHEGSGKEDPRRRL